LNAYKFDQLLQLLWSQIMLMILKKKFHYNRALYFSWPAPNSFCIPWKSAVLNYWLWWCNFLWFALARQWYA